MAFLGGLFGGGGDMARAQGIDINPEAGQIKDADKYREDARGQFNKGIGRTEYIQPKQRSLIESLEQQAAGQGPSLAGEQLKSATNRNLAQQVASAQMARGTNTGLNQRNLMRNQASAGASLAEASAQARMQEQTQARQLLAGQINQEQQSADQLTQHYLQQGFSIAEAQQKALLALEQLKVNQNLGVAGINSGIDQANAEMNYKGAQNLFNTGSSLISSGMSAGMFSGGGGAAGGGGVPGGSSATGNTKRFSGY